jgi:hypothetical protein
MLLGSYSTLIHRAEVQPVRPECWPIRMVQTEILSTLLMSPLDRLRCLYGTTYIGRAGILGTAKLHFTAHQLFSRGQARSPALEGGDDVVIESSCHSGPESFLMEVAKIFDILMALKQRPHTKLYCLILRLTFTHPSSTSRNIDYGY